jgi:hypothetical protein
MMTPDGVESVLIGAYAYLRGRIMFGGSLCTDWVYGSVASDDCYKGTSAGDSSPMNLIERYENSPIDSDFNDRWSDCYNGVARANSVLDVLAGAQKGKSPLPETRALQVEAEAKFLRAWFHFQANKVFEHIPYIKRASELAPLKPEEVPNPDPAWDEIEEDLQFAIDHLPANFAGEPGAQINMLLRLLWLRLICIRMNWAGQKLCSTTLLIMVVLISFPTFMIITI